MAEPITMTFWMASNLPLDPFLFQFRRVSRNRLPPDNLHLRRQSFQVPCLVIHNDNFHDVHVVDCSSFTVFRANFSLFLGGLCGFTSVTVDNVSDEHYNASLLCGRKPRDWSIFYDSITGSAFDNKRHLFNFALLPFEQRINVVSRVQVSSNHAALDVITVNDWVKESICNASSEGKFGASTASFLEFELRGNASFRGWTWVRRRVFMQVVCEKVKSIDFFKLNEEASV